VSNKVLLIWRSCAHRVLVFGSVALVGVAGALSGRHEAKVQSGRVRVRLICEGCDLKTLCSSRLAF
jgi:hypothetical protein